MRFHPDPLLRALFESKHPIIIIPALPWSWNPVLNPLVRVSEGDRACHCNHETDHGFEVLCLPFIQFNGFLYSGGPWGACNR